MTRAWAEASRASSVDVRLLGVFEHGGGPVRDRGQPAVEAGQPLVEVGQALLELGRGLALNTLELRVEARDLRLQRVSIRLQRLEILLELRAEGARLNLGEACARRLNVRLGRCQAVFQVSREILSDAPDPGDRVWIHPQADGQVGYDVPVLERHGAAGRPDVLPLVLDQADELSVRHTNGVRDEALHARRGERLLRDAQGELPGGRRDGSGQRLGIVRQLLLDLALDIDAGVNLLDQVDAERVLNILIAQDLVGGVHHRVGVQHRELDPVCGDRQDQQQRRQHDHRPHQNAAATPLGHRNARSWRRISGGLRRGSRGALWWGRVGLVRHYVRRRDIRGRA